VASSSASSYDLAGGAETIVAQATPPVPGALAVIRVSGPEAKRVARGLCGHLNVDAAWKAQLVVLRDGDGRAMERAVVIPYTGPASYTGEDMVEIMVHGSPALTRTVLERLTALGCRPAEKGEFTRRAVANGKMDLVQAEAVADLVFAQTPAQLELARRHLSGELSRRVGLLREQMVDLLARLEAGLDFAAQGVDPDARDLEARRRKLLASLDSLVGTSRVGQRIRDGIRVVLFGPPNAGKSTVFNRLLSTERAIVTPEEGTTRDLIEAELEIGGLRVILVDTAGVRNDGGGVEREGVRRALDAAGRADLLLVLHPFGARTAEPLAAPSGVPALLLRTKADLAQGKERGGPGLAVSALSGEGWEAFEAALERALEESLTGWEGKLAVNRRQGAALEAALKAVRRARVEEPELAVEELSWAMAQLGGLLGSVCTDDVLDRVFETFCLGK